MAVSWTKSWSASDDGTVFGGSDLQNIQSDIDSGVLTLTGDHTVSGDNTFSGTNSVTGTFTELVKRSEFVVYEDDIVSYEDEMLYYR